jgi:hypothetical protein
MGAIQVPTIATGAAKPPQISNTDATLTAAERTLARAIDELHPSPRSVYAFLHCPSNRISTIDGRTAW